ncbi:MAG: hypothetical protein IJB63_02340 [Alistipes sp.]|nr:hypothetical protein [Alistipes sp.]
MKKLFIAAMALATIVSCSKDEGASVLESSKKSVTVTINNYAKETRHVTDATPAKDAEDLVCASSSTLTIVFTDGGNLVKSFTLSEGKPDGQTGDGTYTFHALPESVDGFFVIGSKRATLKTIPTTKDAAVEAWKANQEDAEWNDIVVYGEHENWTPSNDCTEDGYALYTADVTVKPWKARVEVTEISCADLGDKNRDTAEETPDYLTTLGYEKVTVTSFGIAGAEMQTLSEDNEMTADPAVKSLKPAEGKVWSWNINPDATSNHLLTLNATVDAEPYYEVSSADRTITATKYTSGGADLANFASGHIYKMTIPFTESDLDDESSLICVTANVIIEDWVVVDDVTPVFGN